jgi:hypothetical protein
MEIFPGLSRTNAKPTQISLANIHIASPCPAEWSRMVGDERVRHCAECDLNVYNLSAMTEREAAQLIAKNEGQRMCLQLYRRADGTILTQNCPWSLRTIKRKTVQVASALLTAVMSVSTAFARPQPQENSHPAIENNQWGSSVQVIVMDQQGAVVPGAQVTLRKLKAKDGTEPLAKTLTANSGTAEFGGMLEGRYKLTLEAPHFKKAIRTITLKNQQISRLSIQLKVNSRETTTVEVGGVVVPLIQTDPQVTNVFEGPIL